MDRVAKEFADVASISLPGSVGNGKCFESSSCKQTQVLLTVMKPAYLQYTCGKSSALCPPHARRYGMNYLDTLAGFQE